MSRDPHAARCIRELRIDRGWTPERLSYEISRSDPQNPVSGRTIRRIEATGAIPTVRVMFALARVFGMPVTGIWVVRTNRKAVAA